MPTNTSPRRTPTYRLHKPSGRAVVRLNGRDVYLGAHGSPESRAEYDRVIGEWLAAGRRDVDRPGQRRSVSAMTVARLCAAFDEFAQTHYRKPDGSTTSEVGNYAMVIRILVRLYSGVGVDDFGPLALKATRQAMIDAGWSRKVVNRMVGRVRRIFKWGAEAEIVLPSTVNALATVAGLSRGRTDARETEPVTPVHDSRVDAIKPYVSDQVWAMIEIQRLTGARAGEIVSMTREQIDITGKVWIYRPDHHKTAHRGKSRSIPLGPKAQAVLEPYVYAIERAVDAPLFSPAEAEAKRLDERHAQRKTPAHHGNTRKPMNRRRRRAPSDRYTVNTYRRAIHRACDRVFELPAELARHYVKPEGARKTRRETDAEWRERIGVEAWNDAQKMVADARWNPHQLRHAAITRIQREYGIEKARIIAGHATAMTTDIYVEADTQAAIEIMGMVG